MRTFQQPILVHDLAPSKNPCEPEEWAGDLLTNVDLTVLQLQVSGHLNEMCKGHDGLLPQLYHIVLLAWP